MGGERHARPGHGGGQVLEDILRAGPEAEAVADGDTALQAGRAGALGQGPDFPQTRFARVVDMDVDAPVMLPGQPEKQVQLAVQVPVLPDGVDAAHQVRAHRQRLVHQLVTAGRGKHAILRKGDDLEVCGVRECGLDLEQGLDVPDADIGSDIRMAAERGRAERDSLTDQVRCALGGRRQGRA